MYKRNIDLMDNTLFPKNSIYIDKENPKSDARRIPRVAKSDEEIIAAVTAEMTNTLGAELEP